MWHLLSLPMYANIAPYLHQTRAKPGSRNLSQAAQLQGFLFRIGGSQAESAGVAGGINACEEQRGNLWEHLGVREGLPGLGVLGLQQQLRKAAALQLCALDVRQQAAHDVLQSRDPDVTRSNMVLRRM